MKEGGGVERERKGGKEKKEKKRMRESDT